MSDEQRKALVARVNVWRATATAHAKQREFFLQTGNIDESAFCKVAAEIYERHAQEVEAILAAQ